MYFEEFQSEICLFPFFLFGPTWRSYKLTSVRSFVRSSVRPLVTSFSQDWLIGIFWFFAQRCKMVKLKMWRSPIFKKNFFGPISGLKMPKNRVFWTFWKICSLVFPDFLYKDVELKCANYEKNIFSKKNFFGPNWDQKCPQIGFFGLCEKSVY